MKFHKPAGEVHPDAIDTCRRRGGKWAAYTNIAMDSADFGGIRLLKYGPGCTYETAPDKYPDTSAGPGWKYAPAGFLDLRSGLIVDKEPTS